jgi:aminopeptidase N
MRLTIPRSFYNILALRVLLPVFLLAVAEYIKPLVVYAQQEPDPNIDVTYYRLKIRVTATFPIDLDGSVIMRAISTIDTLRSIRLNLNSLSMKVDSVVMTGRPVGFRQSPKVFTITLDRTYQTGEPVAVEIFYHSDTMGLVMLDSFNFKTHGKRAPLIWNSSEPYGARDWWPCKDHPSDKADSADIIVTVDSTLIVGSQGTLVSVTHHSDGTVTYHWHEQYPIATYLISVAISNYVVYREYFHYTPTDSMMILNYVFPEDVDSAKTGWGVALDGLKIFSKLFGRYPFIKEKYGHAEARGGMEYQTMTSISLPVTEEPVIHELAHQWFGDMITCRTWQNIWLNEGFATYCVALYNESKYGSGAYWDNIWRNMRSARLSERSIFVADTTKFQDIFYDPSIYAKGAIVLHMLRHVLGDTVFFKAMYNYANDPELKYGTATTEDFRSVCERTSGKNLGYFFDEWIYGTGYPKYTYSWSSRHFQGGDSVTLHIVQNIKTTGPHFFIMPIDLRISAEGMDTTITLFNDKADQTFHFITPQDPVLINLDPHDWILK